MWLIPKLDHTIVSILFSSDSMSCCWIQKSPNQKQLLKICAYERYSLVDHEIERLILFNPTFIKKKIHSFLEKHNLVNAFVVCSFDGVGITQKFVTMPTATPHATDFDISRSSAVLSEYRYIYPNHDGQHVFYVYAIPRFIILQYQLMMVSLNANLITMTTSTMALLYTYQAIFGSAFRKSQLAVDMMRSENAPLALISADALRRMAVIPSEIFLSDEIGYIATAIGLFSAETMK
jgi:hypothetical protein